MLRAALLITCLLVAVGASAQQAGLRTLRKSEEVKALSREEAARGLPVRLRGVVTFHNEANGFTIADGGGIWISAVRGSIALRPGDLIEVVGRTDEGHFAPTVLATRVIPVGSAELPPPEELTGPAMRSGEFQAHRVKVKGVVRGRVPLQTEDRYSMALILSTVHGQIPFQLFGGDAGDETKWDDAEVEATGVLLAFFNARGQTQGVRIAANSAADLRMIRPAPGGPFEAPPIALADVLRYSPDGETLHRRRVSGTVTMSRPGKFFFLQDGPRALRVDTLQSEPLAAGDRVEASGFLDVVQNKARLGESVFRRLGGGEPPVPTEITVEQALHRNRFPRAGEYPDFDDRLIALRGRLLTVERKNDDGMLLNLESDGVLVPVELAEAANPSDLSELVPGSEIRVSGICAITYSESGRVLTWPRPIGLRVLARGAVDVEVVRKAPFWTAARLWTALGISSAVLMSAALWIVLLRRTVARRSQELAAEMQARHGAALEFESTLRERTRLAADLHDTLEQSLTGLALQLEAGEALLDSNLDRSRRHLGLGQQLLSRSREDLRRSIWNLRSTALEGGSLEQALHRVAESRASGAGVGIAVECEGTIRPVSDLIAGNLLLLAQEAITNALKHAAAGHIALTLSFSEKSLALRICDDGVGFDPATIAGPSSGHFGLQGMRERIKRLGGSLEITSAPGMGTVIHVIVPC